jgi:hypothetical protein
MGEIVSTSIADRLFTAAEALATWSYWPLKNPK